MKKRENTEINILQRKYDYYLNLKYRCFKTNLDIVMHIDETSYNSLFDTQYEMTSKIENLFTTLNNLLKKQDFENYFKNKVLLFKELDNLATFLEKYRRELKFILDYKKNKEAKQRG